MDERQEQVAMMGQIDASSQEVIVWLGSMLDLDKDAVTLHNELSQHQDEILADRFQGLGS